MIKPHIHVPYSRIFEYVDFIKENKLNIELYFDAQSLDSIKKEDIKKLREALFYKPSLSLHGPFMDLSPGAVDNKIKEVTLVRFNQVFDIAEELCPASIVFHSGYEKWKYAFRVDIWLEESLKTWEKVLPRAEQLDIKIAIENIFEEEPESLTLLMKSIDSPYFGVCFDTGHFNLFSKKDIKEWISCLGNYIFELHLHDNHKHFDEHLSIGSGCFDFKKFFDLINGIDCIYTIEAHSAEDVFKSIKMLDELIK